MWNNGITHLYSSCGNFHILSFFYFESFPNTLDHFPRTWEWMIRSKLILNNGPQLSSLKAISLFFWTFPERADPGNMTIASGALPKRSPILSTFLTTASTLWVYSPPTTTTEHHVGSSNVVNGLEKIVFNSWLMFRHGQNVRQLQRICFSRFLWRHYVFMTLKSVTDSQTDLLIDQALLFLELLS